MDSLNKLLKNYQPKDSDELFVLKSYLENKYSQSLNLSYSSNKIIIEVKSASFANILRMSLTSVLKELKITKKAQILIR